MWSELDECALGADLRVIDSTFCFSLRRFSYRATVGREGECLIHSLLRAKCDLDLSEIAAVLLRNGYAPQHDSPASLQKMVPAGQAVARFKPDDTLLTFLASL